MILKMLIENECKNKDMHKEHGLSLFIEVQGKKLLFDTGASGAFVDNAIRMGINVEDIDNLIISHAHSDHGGGLLRFLQVNKKASVFISDKAKREYYFKLLFIKENVSVSSEVLDAYSDRICFISDFIRIEDGIVLVSGFQRKYPLVKSSKNLLVKRDGQFVKDEFDHEIALVIHNAGKLVIITGCSHNGVENMVDTIIGHFPGMPVQTIIGGFHLMGFPFPDLMGESRANITTLGKRLLDYKIEKTYTCHCTGKRGYNILKETMGDKLDYFYTGMQVEI